MKYIVSSDYIRVLPLIHEATIPSWPSWMKGERVDLVYDDPSKFIEAKYRKDYRPGDFDGGGDEEIIFKFDNGEFWILKHDYWASYDEDGDWCANYEHSIAKIESTDPRIPKEMQFDLSRDWLLPPTR